MAWIRSPQLTFIHALALAFASALVLIICPVRHLTGRPKSPQFATFGVSLTAHFSDITGGEGIDICTDCDLHL